MDADTLRRYARDIVAFAEAEYVLPETGRSIALEDHQRAILRHVFAKDKDGRFPYRTVIYSAPKKSGKTEVAGLVGTWFALTQEPHNEVYCLSNDLEQTIGRVFRRAKRAFELNPRLRAAARTRATEIELTTGTTITALASEYRGAAGASPGLTLWDELWGYTSEGARRLWDEMTPVPTRTNSLRVITTYAGFTEESELLESLYRLGVREENRLEEFGDVPCYADPESSLFVYWDHEPRMPWQDEAYYKEQRRTLRPSAFLRLHRNEWVSSESGLFAPEEWDACTERYEVPAGAALFIGVDASQKHDRSAVVSCFWQDGIMRMGPRRWWQPTPDEPLDLENTVESYLLDLAGRYRLFKVLFDPYQMARSAATLERAGLPLEEYPQSVPNLTQMTELLLELVKTRGLRLYPDAELRREAMSAVAKESPRGLRIVKERSTAKIDSIVALAMAAWAAHEAARGYVEPWMGPYPVNPPGWETGEDLDVPPWGGQVYDLGRYSEVEHRMDWDGDDGLDSVWPG